MMKVLNISSDQFYEEKMKVLNISFDEFYILSCSE